MENKNNFEAAAVDAQVFRRKEVTGELNFIENLDELDAALEADTIVCRFKNPNGGDPLDFEMRPMTPGETAIYYQTLFGHTLLEATDGNLNPDAANALDDAQAQRLEDEIAAKKYDTRLLNILEGCIISHPGLTAERMRKWSPFYITRLHNALLEGSRPSKSVAQFLNVDSSGGE